ncbi:phosphotransferase [Paralimibaculum aggregatum]|uniref:Phosphotransferase n=1 Tax=Paralimibaculum aggregatum TaxID=3036245 RepID=A0ABQ6LMJ7_9RHOB|nr:phosphotransferase [Limibaculum sp. NKW23]GMG82912.1 phosphotransferase [Limibaculum sp. NKW23]
MTLAATGVSARISGFLDRAGWGAAALAPLAGDASARRYLRLAMGADRAVLMDAPPAAGEDIRPFAAVTGWLRAAGLSAPEILAADAEAGLLLLEDLGDALLARVAAAESAAEPALYAAAVDLLAAALPTPPDSLAPYDMAVLQREAGLALDWYLAAGDVPPARDMRAEYEELLAEALATVAGARDTLVLRDYHAENLIWLPDRAGPARVGLLDYQDALAGHAAYDLVSLLEDARRDTAPELQAAMRARYLDARPDLDRESFAAAYAALGAQRNLKIVGIFARLCLRDGKPRYLELIPRVWRHLARDLSHPALAPLADWVARRLPPPEPARLARLAALEGARADV